MKRKGFVALLAGLLGLVMVAAPAGAAAPAVLGELPANSQVVVVTQPLSQLSGKVDVFARSAGLPVSPDQPVKVEDMLGAEMGIAGQLDASRGLALAIGNVVDDPEGTMVAFIPVNNAVAAIEAMGAEPAPGQAGVFMLPDPDMFTYLMPAGKHLLLGSSPQSMRAAAAGPKGIRLSAADQEMFANSEVAAWIDLRSVMPKARTELMAAIAENEDLAAHPSFQKLATDAVNRLGEVQMASGGLRITAEGLRLTLRGQGAAGSELAEYLSGHAMADTSMISKLPAGPYIMAFAGQFDSKLLLGPLDALATAVKADPTFGAQLQPAKVDTLMKTLTDMYQAQASGPMASAIYLPTAGPNAAGNPMMNQVGVTVYSTAAQVAASKKTGAMAKSITEVSTDLGYPVAMSYKQNAGAAGGVSYDEMTMDLSQLPWPEEVAASLKQQWGGTMAMTYQMAYLENNMVASGMGTGALEQAIGLVKGGGSLPAADPTVAKAAKNLPGKANMYAVVHAGRYIQMIMQSMAAQGPEGQMNPMLMMMGPMLMQMQGALGMSASLSDGAATVDLFIPTEMIQTSVGMFMQMQMGMQQPPQQGGGEW